MLIMPKAVAFQFTFTRMADLGLVSPILSLTYFTNVLPVILRMISSQQTEAISLRIFVEELPLTCRHWITFCLLILIIFQQCFSIIGAN